MSHRFAIADVFTGTAFGGNQLAVFPDARGLSDRAMQALAREFNFAETTFVLPPEDPRHTRRVRIFTPAAEIPFAGHPTVGTAAVLARLGLIEVPGGTTTVVLEEGVGPVAVDIVFDGASTVTRLTLETDVESPADRPAPEAVAAALTLPADAVVDAWFAGVGIPFCFVHLADRGAGDRAPIRQVDGALRPCVVAAVVPVRGRDAAGGTPVRAHVRPGVRDRGGPGDGLGVRGARGHAGGEAAGGGGRVRVADRPGRRHGPAEPHRGRGGEERRPRDQDTGRRIYRHRRRGQHGRPAGLLTPSPRDILIAERGDHP